MWFEHGQRGCVVAAFICAFTAIAAAAPDWEATLSKEPPGNFPELRRFHATYHFGWSGFTAATGDIHFQKIHGDHFQLEATGRTIGLVRALWKMDTNYRGIANAQTLRPIESQQIETYRSKKIVTHLAFTNLGVVRTRAEGSGAPSKPNPFNFTNLFDLHTALLYLRSQPLKDHAVYRIAVYPATSAYVATVTVIGREKISVRAGAYNAIKVDLQLKRVGKNMELEPHRKFRRATAWVSDDGDRIPLRIEAQIFVGTVFAELQNVQFENDGS